MDAALLFYVCANALVVIQPVCNQGYIECGLLDLRPVVISRLRDMTLTSYIR